jgi:hypothetical protein
MTLAEKPSRQAGSELKKPATHGGIGCALSAAKGNALMAPVFPVPGMGLCWMDYPRGARHCETLMEISEISCWQGQHRARRCLALFHGFP